MLLIPEISVASVKERIDEIFKALKEDKELNLTDEEASGIAGSIAVESPKVSPTQRQWGGGPGRGLLQWEIQTQAKNKTGQKRDKGEDNFHKRRGEDLKKKYLSHGSERLTTSISGEDVPLHRRSDESNFRKAELQGAAFSEPLLKQQVDFALEELKQNRFERKRFNRARKSSRTPEEFAVAFTKENLRPGKPHFKKRKKKAREIFNRITKEKEEAKPFQLDMSNLENEINNANSMEELENIKRKYGL